MIGAASSKFKATTIITLERIMIDIGRMKYFNGMHLMPAKVHFFLTEMYL
jgi:hypothetical protein